MVIYAHEFKPEGYPSVSPYLVVPGAERTIRFAQEAFEGHVLRRFDADDGSVLHAEVRVGDGVVMLGDAGPEWPAMAGLVHLYLADVDRAYARALAAGASSVQAPSENDGDPDRRASVKDPVGTIWALASQRSSQVAAAATAPSGQEHDGATGSDRLRRVQEPLKERYRHDPEAAVITLSASGTLHDEGVACKVQTGRALIEAGLHPSTGGDGTLACSGDLLLEALVACAGVTLRAVATAMDLPLQGGVVTAEGELDVRGTLGVDRQALVGFRSVRLTFALTGDLDEEQLATLVRRTERACVVLQTLRSSLDVQVQVEAPRPSAGDGRHV